MMMGIEMGHDREEYLQEHGRHLADHAYERAWEARQYPSEMEMDSGNPFQLQNQIDEDRDRAQIFQDNLEWRRRVEGD